MSLIGSPVQSSSSAIPKIMRKKRVALTESIDAIPSPAPFDQCEDSEWGDFWYGPDEIERFKQEAREDSRRIRMSNQNYPAGTLFLCPENESHQRGLEHRACLERQRRRHVAIYYVLTAYKKLRNDAERLSLISQHFTSWATALALEEAKRDFQRAYGSSVGQKRRGRCDEQENFNRRVCQCLRTGG